MRLGIRRGITLPLTLGLLVALAGCGGGAGSPAPSGAGTTRSTAAGSTRRPAGDPPLRIVATTTVLADLVKHVGGGQVSVQSLVPKGGEVHTFDPRPSDAVRLGEAQLIVMNGLGLDEWLGRLARDAGAEDVPRVVVAEDLSGARYIGGEAVNPHLWLDVGLAQRYVERIATALSAADPVHAAVYQQGASAYRARLGELDAWVRQQVDTIPTANRKLVSFHEAFPYFARAYGLQIVGSVTSAPGQDPSAGEVARLIDAIRASGARAVLTEVQFNPDVARRIAEDAGVKVVSDLYNDSLGEPPVDSYEGLIRWDVERIVQALR